MADSLNGKFFKADGYFTLRRKPTIKMVKDAIEDMTRLQSGTTYWQLCRDDYDRDWYLVFGFTEADSNEPESAFHNEGHQLAAKVAWQPYNGGSQCDFDMDFQRPIDYGNQGEVFDTIVYIGSANDAKMVINDLWKSWMTIKKDWLKRPEL